MNKFQGLAWEKKPDLNKEEIMAWGKLLSREQDVLDEMVASEQ